MAQDLLDNLRRFLRTAFLESVLDLGAVPVVGLSMADFLNLDLHFSRVERVSFLGALRL